jgi:hypothetical protein
VARVLYYESIAVAWLRHRHRITSLNDSDLKQGMEWVLAQEWVPDDMKEIVRRATDSLRASEKRSPEP